MATALTQAAPDRAARILVVDDVEDNRDLLILRLEREGYRNIASAEDGEEALALLDAQEFDLVLLDVMMPRVDGYQVLERLRAAGRLHDLPIIVISAVSEIDSVVRCIELGAVDYLTKPFNPVVLRARVGASLEKKRLRDEVRVHMARLAEELEAARELQRSMVPASFPDAAQPVEIFARMEPAREVGGDLYDFFFLADGRLCFLTGDVSGKGVPAALFMARTKNLIRLVTGFMAEAGAERLSPDAIISRVNRELCEDNATFMFVTLFFGLLDPASGELHYCNAGHDPPYWLSARGVEPVPGAQGMALGVQAEFSYATGKVRLGRGDTLFLSTDGITEAVNPQDELFSKSRLEAVLRDAVDRPITALVDGVAEAVKTFADAAPQSDDITAMALRLK